jgi:Tfp pilus assembly protein PilW
MLRGPNIPARLAGHDGRPRRRALSIVEVLISLAISSLLLIGVAAAYSASADAIEVNDKFFRATQSGRVTLNQMLTEIRRAEFVFCAPTNDSIIITRPDTTKLPDEDSREYKYNPETKRVTLQIFYKSATGSWSSPEYTMASNMETARFGPPARIRETSGRVLEVRVPVTLEVKIGGNSIRLSGSSSPRRAAQR